MKTIEFDMNAYTESLNDFVRGDALTMPATAVDPECETPEFYNRCTEELVRLIKPKNIMELDDVDVERLMLLYATHKGDLLGLGEVMNRYFLGLAENQAFETVKYEMEGE